MTVYTHGRTDLDAFFTVSGYYGSTTRWTHYPLLAFETQPSGDVKVHLLSSQAQVRSSALHDDTPCMQQWGGQWSSDFFHFTLGQARAALAKKP